MGADFSGMPRAENLTADFNFDRVVAYLFASSRRIFRFSREVPSKSAKKPTAFSILFAYKNGMIGLNDRVKLRPLIVGYKGSRVYMASEESAIRIIEQKLYSVFAPKAGEHFIVELNSK